MYKSGVSFTNMYFSIYKQASRLTNWRFGLQLSLSRSIPSRSTISLIIPHKIAVPDSLFAVGLPSDSEGKASHPKAYSGNASLLSPPTAAKNSRKERGYTWICEERPRNSVTMSLDRILELLPVTADSHETIQIKERTFRTY